VHRLPNMDPNEQDPSHPRAEMGSSASPLRPGGGQGNPLLRERCELELWFSMIFASCNHPVDKCFNGFEVDGLARIDDRHSAQNIRSKVRKLNAHRGHQVVPSTTTVGG